MKNVSSSIKDECIFVSLASYAHDIIKQNDINAFNGEAMAIACCIDKHFKKDIKRYTKSKTDKIMNYLKNVIGPAFPDKINASIIMVATLNYLLKEKKHKESKLVFSHLIFKIQNIIDTLEKSEHADELKKAYKTIIDMKDEKTTGFKINNEQKEKMLTYQYTLISIFIKILLNIPVNEKNKKIINKLKNIISIVEIENFNNYIRLDIEDKFEITPEYLNLYVLKGLLDLITNLGTELSTGIPIKKLKSINFNYLITNKVLLEEVKEKINKNICELL